MKRRIVRREGISRLTVAGAFLSRFTRKEKPFESSSYAKQFAYSLPTRFARVSLLYQTRTYFQNKVR